LTDGTKIIAVGQMRAIICASWPAPEVIGRHEWPSLPAVRGHEIGDAAVEDHRSKRASDFASIRTPSSAASRARNCASAARPRAAAPRRCCAGRR